MLYLMSNHVSLIVYSNFKLCSDYKLSYHEGDVRVVSILPGITKTIFRVLTNYLI